MRITPATLSILISVAAGGAAQDAITLLEGTSPTARVVREIDERTPGAAGRVVLRGVEILPLEITLRTSQQELRFDRPRRVRRQDLWRVELPAGGRILRYRLGGGARYGFLWMTAGGRAVVLLELPGGGLGGKVDPFADRFGVGYDGRHAAFSTLDGRLWVARLDGKNYSGTGKPVRPLRVVGSVDPVSVCVGRGHVFFQTRDARVWRCALTDGAAPQDVTPSAPPGSRLKEEMAMSGDGTTVAFLLGPKRAFRIYLLAGKGPARALPLPAAKYEEPGYLPETAGGPRMMLDETASRLLYTDSTQRDEIYLMNLTGRTATVHITSDANFVPYIGVGIFPVFVAGGALHLGVGDPDAHDWYEARTGRALVRNLTGTAGTRPPFGRGKLAPQTSGVLASGHVVVAEKPSPTAKATRLRVVDPRTGKSTVLAGSLRVLPELGASLAGAPDLHVSDTAGDLLVSGARGGVLVGAPAGLLLSHSVVGPARAFRAMVVSTPQGLGAVVFRLPDGSLAALPAEPGIRQITLTRSYGFLLNGTTLRYWSLGVSATIKASGVPIVLSGAGA